MRLLRDDLLLQITLATVVVSLAVALVLASILDSRLTGIVALLEQHGTAVQAGSVEPSDTFSIPNITQATRDLGGTVYFLVAGAIVVLYAALGGFAWNGARKIRQFRAVAEEVQAPLQAAEMQLAAVQAQLESAKAQIAEAEANAESSTDGMLSEDAVDLIVAERTAVLAASEELYRDRFENAPDMMAVVQLDDGKITDCNQTLADVIGRSREEIIGTSVYDLYSPESQGIARENLAEFAETGTIPELERMLIRADGSEIKVLELGSPIYDEHGKIGASHSSWRDVTEYTEEIYELIRS